MSYSWKVTIIMFKMHVESWLWWHVNVNRALLPTTFSQMCVQIVTANWQQCICSTCVPRGPIPGLPLFSVLINEICCNMRKSTDDLNPSSTCACPLKIKFLAEWVLEIAFINLILVVRHIRTILQQMFHLNRPSWLHIYLYVIFNSHAHQGHHNHHLYRFTIVGSLYGFITFALQNTPSQTLSVR